jgi:DNA-binding NarL/FixJ family response regulator
MPSFGRTTGLTRVPPPVTAAISVMLVDALPLVRRGFRRLLEDDPDLMVVGEASSGDEAVRHYLELRPDVVVMDSVLPGTSGVDAARAILALHPHARVLMLSVHGEDILVRQALDNGASGYVLKSALDLDLAMTVKRVHAGEQVVDPAIRRTAAHLEGQTRLTPRKLEVLQLVCDGLSNKEIADRLGLSANTVAVHRARIMKALGVHKTAELVVYAIQHSLIKALRTGERADSLHRLSSQAEEPRATRVSRGGHADQSVSSRALQASRRTIHTED